MICDCDCGGKCICSALKWDWMRWGLKWNPIGGWAMVLIRWLISDHCLFGFITRSIWVRRLWGNAFNLRYLSSSVCCGQDGHNWVTKDTDGRGNHFRRISHPPRSHTRSKTSLLRCPVPQPVNRVAISFDLSSGNVSCCQWLDVDLLKVRTTKMGPFTWPEKQDSFSLQQSISLPQPNWAVCQSEISYPATHVLSPDNLESRIVVESPFSDIPTWNWKSHPDGCRYACVWKCSCLTSDPGGKK